MIRPLANPEPSPIPQNRNTIPAMPAMIGNVRCPAIAPVADPLIEAQRQAANQFTRDVQLRQLSEKTEAALGCD